MRSPNMRDQQRLDRAARASGLPEPATETEIRSQLEALNDAIIALQSTDDLGSTEANEAAWQQMLALQRRETALRARLTGGET